MIEVISLKMVNCYIIKNDNNDNEILVDTGTLDKREELFEQIKDRNIVGIILTHGHSDHASNAKYLSEKFKCPVMISRDDFDLFANQLKRPLFAEGFLGKLALKATIKTMEREKLQVPKEIVYITEADDLTKYGFDNVKILSLPGHTRGSIALLYDKKHLICGDILMNWRKPKMAHLYEEKASLINSIEKIKDLMPQKIYPGHGKVFNYDECFQMEKISNVKIGENKPKIKMNNKTNVKSKKLFFK